MYFAFQLLKKGGTKKPAKGHGRKSDDHGRVLFSARIEPSATRSSSSCSKAQGSLHLLKDLRKIQTSLRADDIVWDS